MASTASKGKPNSNGAEDLNKMPPVPSVNPTATADTTTPEPSKASSTAPLIDEEGFITPHPIKERKLVSIKTARLPEFRGKFTPKSQSSNGSQPESSSTSGKKGSANKRQHQPQKPGGEIRIGPLHSRSKKSTLTTTHTASQPVTTTTTTSNISGRPTTANRQRGPAAPCKPKHPIKEEGWTIVSACKTTPSTPTPSIKKAKTQPRETNTKTSSGRPKKTRPIIIFDANHKLSWADAVIEEEKAAAAAAAAAAYTAPNPPLPAAPESAQNQQKQKGRKQRKEHPGKKRENAEKEHRSALSRNSKPGIDLTQADGLGSNRFAVLMGSVDCI